MLFACELLHKDRITPELAAYATLAFIFNRPAVRPAGSPDRPRLETYRDFGEQVKATKRKILSFLIDLKNQGKQIVGYGAPGKGNTLLNYCGIRSDILDYTVDRNPYKQGKYTPGTHIPIVAPGRISETRPDYILILPRNLKDEICSQMAYVREWGCQFIAPIPEPKILP